MKEYEDKKYDAWKEQVEANLIVYLKKNLLNKPSASSATTHRSVVDEQQTISDDAQEFISNQGNYDYMLIIY